MDVKNFLLRHGEKLFLGISVCYLIYVTIYAFVVLNLEMNRINTKLTSLNDTIDRKLITGEHPPISTELKDASQLELRFTTPPSVEYLHRPHIFNRFIKEETVSEVTSKDLMKTELQTYKQLQVAAPGDTEFIFKGGTVDLALLQVRKLYKDTWRTESFIIEKGKNIGEEKTIKGEAIDFNTHCKLVEIVPSAQKPLAIRKTTVLRNEKGEFLGTSVTEERYMISTSKIVFEDKKGEAYDLWIGELVNLGTETVAVLPGTDTASTN